MPKPPVTLLLDARRLEQLKSIATALGTTSAGAVAEFIRSQIAAGVIAPSIPGVSVEKVAGGVSIELTPGQSKTYSNTSALRLAECIREVASREAVSTVNLDHGFAVLRQGRGLKIAAPFPGPEVPFTVDLAEDVASLIERAAE